jgi:hypothetical protein
VGIEKAAGVKLFDSAAKRLAIPHGAGGWIVLWRVWQCGSGGRRCCARRTQRANAVASGGGCEAS